MRSWREVAVFPAFNRTVRGLAAPDRFVGEPRRFTPVLDTEVKKEITASARVIEHQDGQAVLWFVSVVKTEGAVKTCAASVSDPVVGLAAEVRSTVRTLGGRVPAR